MPIIKPSDRQLLAEKIDPTTITRTYFGKIGIVYLKLKPEKAKAVRERKTGELFNEYQKELHSRLSNSPHVMEISPTLGEIEAKTSNEELIGGGTFYLGLEVMTFPPFLKIRITVPKRKAKELGTVWDCPEQFIVYFDGFLFFAVSEVSQISTRTDVGIVARKLLEEALAESDYWQIVRIGPTPIHPDFCVLARKEENPEEVFSPQAFEVAEDLFVVVSDKMSLDALAKSIFFDSDFAFQSFYHFQDVQRTLGKEAVSLSKLNQQLSILLAEHFKKGSLKSLFSQNSHRIRKLLSEMHLLLQKISNSELAASNIQEEAKEAITDSFFLGPLKKYFSGYMKQRNYFNNAEQHTLMNFASQETSNVSIVQATLLAASIGAILGGLATVVVQMLFK